MSSTHSQLHPLTLSLSVYSVEEEFSLDMTATAATAAESTSQDFGRSLVGGYSDSYQPDLVLQATSAPVSKFKERLITDLSSMVKVNNTGYENLNRIAPKVLIKLISTCSACISALLLASDMDCRHYSRLVFMGTGGGIA